jgi:hypothetical protein
MSYTDDEAAFRAHAVAACHDLTAPQRAKVITAMESWLQERHNEGSGHVDEFGDADEYVAELRAAMELPAPTAAAASSRARRMGLPQWIAVAAAVGLAFAALMISLNTHDAGLKATSSPTSGSTSGEGQRSTVAVPPVVGMTLAAAKLTLRAAHLIPVRGASVCANTVPKSIVASERPVAQTEVALGAAVLVQLSRGRSC